MNEDLLDLPGMQQVLAAGQVDPPRPDVVAAARAAVHQTVRHEQAVVLGAMRARRRRRMLLGGIAAASVVALVLAVPTIGVNGHRGASAEAATFLRGVATTAAAQQSASTETPYWYSHSRVTSDGKTKDRQIWLGRTASGRLVETAPDGSLDAPPLDGPAVFPMGSKSVDWAGLDALPTDPSELTKVLRKGAHGAGPDDDSEMFTIVGDLLRESPASPALRSALYGVAAEVPGVQLVGEVRDATGRHGTAIERSQGSGGLLRYVIDPSDGRLLEEREAGLVITYVEQGPVPSSESTLSQS
jgi:hypothetical protein